MDRSKQDGMGLPQIGAPKSVRIAEMLEGEIRSGSLEKGAALESEHALVKRFAVSRNTVRKSLGILSEKGLITTLSGIGSFVTYGGQTIDDRRGWSVALSSGQDTLAARILRLDRGPFDLDAPTALHSDLKGDPPREFLFVDRLRFQVSTGLAVSLERSRVAWRTGFHGILQDGLEGGSLTQTLQAKGLSVASGDEWATVLPALAKDDADLLGRAPGEPMLLLRRLTRTADGAVLEYVQSILDPVRFGLHMRF